ncbi:GumC family protein [Roseibium sp. Sym1]|uniref:GumC family protein n=1 Tax=Roseibium sp. Sym1 TaxID=3016006 RepID=UPI0022B45765|nr:exopolysaccharide transport family protein [Roseibium sp. Sym1]
MIEDARSQSRDDITLDILSILQVLRRRILLIGLVAAVFVIATALYSLRLTPIYSATSQVLFDPLVRQPFDDPNRPSRTSAGTESIDSQISVIHADTVLRPVARDNNLSEDPFFGEGAPGLMSQFKSLFGGSQAKDPGTLEAQETDAVKALSGATSVKRVGQTFVINISVESPSPVQAAVLANAIAESYLADQRRQVSTASDQAATQIDDRLVDLRERLRKAETDIQKFRAANNLQSANEGLLLTDQELSGLNTRLIDARAALADATAKYDEIQRVLKNGVDDEAIGDVVSSGTISSLRQQYAQAARNEAQLLADLLPSHPSVVRARSQLDRLRGLIRDEVKRIADSTRIDVQVNQERVANLEQQLKSTRDLSSADEAASIKLRELETEAQATRQLYEIALSRAKEISQLEQVVLPNARIISPAVPPDSPIFPKKKIMVILAGILGLMVGTILAVGGEAIRIAKKHLLPDFSASAAAMSAMPAPATPAPSQLERPDAAPPAPATHRSGRQSLLRAAQMVRPGLKLVSQLPWLPLDGDIDNPRALNTDAISLVQDAIDQYYLGGRGPNRRFGESVDQILDDLDPHASHQSARIVFFTSPSLGQGQTITALALALGGAHRDLRVLLADGEPKQRMLSHDLSLDESAFGGPLRDRVVSFDELGIDFVSLVSGLPKYKHHRMSVRQAFEFAEVARNFDLVIVDGVALPQLTDDDPLAALATDFLVTVSEREEGQISMPILSRDLLTIADGRPTGLVRTMTGLTGPTGPTGRKYG